MADPAKEPSNWTEHTQSDGRRYYYNKVNKLSSWKKPECLKNPDEKLNTTVWKEYKTATGRDDYYYPITKQSGTPMTTQPLPWRDNEQTTEEVLAQLKSQEKEKAPKQEESEWKTLDREDFMMSVVE